MSRRENAKVERSPQWTMTIRPRVGLLNLDLADLWRHRDLIGLFVRRDFVSVYKQTLLGPIWFLIQPVLNTIVYLAIFGGLVHMSTDDIPGPLFYFSGSMLWQYFSTCVTKTSDTFLANASVFGKVYFPRLTVPISNVVANLITFSIQFALFIVLLGFYMLRGAPIHLTIAALALPLILLCMAALGLGTGVLVSAMTTKYRDLRQLVSFGVQLWMYATPVVYPLSQVPGKWRWAVVINPMTPLLEAFRLAFMGKGSVDFTQLTICGVVTILILIVGILMFNRVERTFMDVV